MDHLRKVQSGQKLDIPAATFNSFVDAARDFKDRQRDKRSKPEPYFPDSGIILVANQSGEDRNRFDVLGVTEPIILPETNLIEFKRRPTFRGVKPTPALVDDLLFMVDDVGVGSCVEATSGTVVWRERVGGNHSASPVYVAGRLYFFDDTGTTTVLSPTRQYEVLARNSLDAGCMASPAIVGRAIYLRTKTHLYRIENCGS